MRQAAEGGDGAPEVGGGEGGVRAVAAFVQVDGVDGLLLVGSQHQMRRVDGHKHLTNKNKPKIKKNA